MIICIQANDKIYIHNFETKLKLNTQDTLRIFLISIQIEFFRLLCSKKLYRFIYLNLAYIQIKLCLLYHDYN